MKFSVLICTYNRPQLLHQSLISLLYDTNEKPNQVVVVNGGDEQTDDVVYSFFEKHPRREKGKRSSQPVTGYRSFIEIILIKTVNKNLAASRNVGLPHCNGEIIAMTDDDAEVFPDWVTRMKHVHREHPEAGGVGGPVIGTDVGSLTGKISDVITFPNWPIAQYVRTLPGVNVSYKKEVVKAAGLQDETLFRGEDVDYNWRVQKLGYKIYFEPSIKVYHHHRPSLRGLLHQHYMYGRAYYLVRRKWPDMYCVYPHGFHQAKDLARAVNFLAALIYQPLLSAGKLTPLKDRLLALPILFATGITWIGGMIEQKIRFDRQKKKEIANLAGS